MCQAGGLLLSVTQLGLFVFLLVLLLFPCWFILVEIAEGFAIDICDGKIISRKTLSIRVYTKFQQLGAFLFVDFLYFFSVMILVIEFYFPGTLSMLIRKKTNCKHNYDDAYNNNVNTAAIQNYLLLCAMVQNCSAGT